jgi:hypothetical protein
MLASIFISIVSLVLLVYWFRYSCALVLRSREDQVAIEPVLGELDLLSRSLERDYRMLAYLWQHAAGLAGQPLEGRLLMLDFKLMRIWFRITRTIAPVRARLALTEMAAVVSFLGQQMSEQAGVAPAPRQASSL